MSILGLDISKKSFDCGVTGRVIFGSGRIKDLALYGKRTGKKAFIATSLKDHEITRIILRLLEKSKVKYLLFDDVNPDPKPSEVEIASKYLKEGNCDYIIGLGGGSSIDFAKAVSVAVVNIGSIWDYVDLSHTKPLKVKSALPIIAIPTTSGTGSEATKWSVIINPDTGEKAAIESEDIIPKIALVDPALTKTLPKDLTATTGVDALTHAIEAFISLNSNPYSDILAAEAIGIIYKYLPRAVKDGSDLATREKMAWGSTLAGMAFNHTGTCLVHAMGHVLGGRFGIDHGTAMSICLLPVLEFNFSCIINKLAKLSGHFGYENVDKSKKVLARHTLTKLASMVSGLGIGHRLLDYGIKKDMLEDLAGEAFNYLTGMLKANPRNINKKQLLDLFKIIL